jgi:pyruvate dehydrogenase kinase 2/3/4
MLNYNNRFIQLIDKIKKRHSPTTETMARGIMEVKQHWKKTNSPLGMDENTLPMDIQAFLDNFYMSRIGIRMLIGQHVSVSQPMPDDYVGIICTKTK